jgi:hypothetical protein
MASSLDSPGGVAPDALNDVDDFVARFRAGALDDGDRSATGLHPLPLFIQGIIESMTRVQLGQEIVGFTEEKEEQLRSARRSLEEEDTRQAFQGLLFASEAVCAVIREVDYGEGEDDQEANSRFFEQLFPEWLEQLRIWASGEQYQELADRIATTRDSYTRIAGSIVTDDTQPAPSRHSRGSRSKANQKSRRVR